MKPKNLMSIAKNRCHWLTLLKKCIKKNFAYQVLLAKKRSHQKFIKYSHRNWSF